MRITYSPAALAELGRRGMGGRRSWLTGQQIPTKEQVEAAERAATAGPPNLMRAALDAVAASLRRAEGRR